MTEIESTAPAKYYYLKVVLRIHFLLNSFLSLEYVVIFIFCLFQIAILFVGELCSDEVGYPKTWKLGE